MGWTTLMMDWHKSLRYLQCFTLNSSRSLASIMTDKKSGPESVWVLMLNVGKCARMCAGEEAALEVIDVPWKMPQRAFTLLVVHRKPLSLLFVHSSDENAISQRSSFPSEWLLSTI